MSQDKPHEEELGHVYDDEGVCLFCRLDGVEAAWYSARGYAHEYPEYRQPCWKRMKAERDTKARAGDGAREGIKP